MIKNSNQKIKVISHIGKSHFLMSAWKKEEEYFRDNKTRRFIIIGGVYNSYAKRGITSYLKQY